MDKAQRAVHLYSSYQRWNEKKDVQLVNMLLEVICRHRCSQRELSFHLFRLFYFLWDSFSLSEVENPLLISVLENSPPAYDSLSPWKPNQLRQSDRNRKCLKQKRDRLRFRVQEQNRVMSLPSKCFKFINLHRVCVHVFLAFWGPKGRS